MEELRVKVKPLPEKLVQRWGGLEAIRTQMAEFENEYEKLKLFMETDAYKKQESDDRARELGQQYKRQYPLESGLYKTFKYKI